MKRLQNSEIIASEFFQPIKSSGILSNLKCEGKAYRKVFLITTEERKDNHDQQNSKTDFFSGNGAFEKMTPNEKYQFFLHQSYEIKQLKRKIRKSPISKSKALKKALLKAQERIKASSNLEFEDQRNCLDNLLSSISTSKLVPNTLQFARICTILRNCLKGTEQKDLPFTRKEIKEISFLPKNNKIIEALKGKKEGMREEESVREYLNTQAEIIRGMDFEGFVNWMERTKK